MAENDPNRDLHLLQESRTPVPASPGEAKLETFDNRHPGRDYLIEFDCPEFTALCPVTGQPDFGHITIRYVADAQCVESKSLKIYLLAFRNHGSFHEEVVNRILDDFVAACQPRWIEIEGRFRPRGGISINVRATWPDGVPTR